MKEGGEGLSRRRLLQIGGAAVATAAVGGTALLLSNGNDNKDEQKELPKTVEHGVEMVNVPSSLRGRKLNDLFTHYTGIAGLVPDKVPADFPTQQLPKLWAEKERRHGETPAVAEARKEFIATYDQKKAEKMGWRGFREHAQLSIDSLRGTLDWQGFGKTFGLTSVDLRLVHELESEINGTSLIAYCLTELMPGTDGRLNRDMLDFLLHAGGHEYVERIPAVNDEKLSFGPYQFTEFALFDTGHERRGASRVNRHVPQSLRLPGSVVKMKGDDHHKAAYLFALCNLALLVKGIDENDKHALLGRSGKLHEPIVEFIATAHNLPAVAIKDFRNYLSAFLGRDPRPQPKPRWVGKGKNRKEIPAKPLPPIKLGANADYLQHARGGGTVWSYAHKTRANYRTLISS